MWKEIGFISTIWIAVFTIPLKSLLRKQSLNTSLLQYADFIKKNFEPFKVPENYKME